MYRGSSLEPKLRIRAPRVVADGRGASPVRRSRPGKGGGGQGSENVGMSSNRTVRKPSHRMAEVSAATIIVGGLVGPKARPKGVADGQTVEIPSPRADERVRPGDGAGRAERGAGDAASNRAGAPARGRRGGGESGGDPWRFGRGRPPRKAPGGRPRAPVPQTDAGGRVREHRGGRVSPRQGTRQVGPVTSGEGTPR